jgi:hypothetical protein
MESRDIMQEMNQRRGADHTFIKWWRREHDFINFELLEHFEQRLSREEGIKWMEGFQLLDTEQMWQELQNHFPDRVSREKRHEGEVLVWRRPGKEEQVCLFTPENLMTVFDVESRGVVIDSGGG